jgi:hypothetical protein
VPQVMEGDSSERPAALAAFLNHRIAAALAVATVTLP